MLRIAVPNKGGLSEPAVRLLNEAGYRTKRRGRELFIEDKKNNVEIFFLRPRDIAVYVGAGYIQAGITGRDLLLDSGVIAEEVMDLEFASSTFRFAAPVGTINNLEQLHGKRIATSYDHLVHAYLQSHNIEAKVVHLDGAVESSVQLGVADVIADVVQTGSTLKAAGLATFGQPILKSTAILITTAPYIADADLNVLTQRLQGILTARNYVLVDYNVSRDNLAAAVEVTPGISSPTISRLHDSNWMAVRSMVLRKNVNQVVDELNRVGGTAILVTELMSCRV